MKITATLILFIGILANASAERLDDSLSPRQQLDMAFDWKFKRNLDGVTHEELNILVADVRHVETRLNTEKYIGQHARIFLELPINVRGINAPQGLRLSWLTNGVFLVGSVTPGNRRLIFDGTITQSVMSDIFDFSIELDSRYASGSLNFEPRYEIELSN